MADFCKEHSFEMWGSDTEDLAGLVTEVQFKDEGLAGIALCESCGHIYVDHTGQRVRPSEDGQSWEVWNVNEH